MHIFLALLAVVVATGLYHRLKPLPAGLSFCSPWHPTDDLRLLIDHTAVDRAGNRLCEQEIFTALIAAIGQARRLVLLDFFLYNAFQGQLGEQGQPLAEKLTRTLIDRKRQCPELTVIVITDPINTVYGSMPSAHFDRLEAAGIRVVFTRLDRLRDSNFLYSSLWHLCIRPLGSGPGRLLANPFGPGRVSLRSFLRLLNFKANHRKVLIADNGKGDLLGLVSSANPHDGSSAHTNTALCFTGPAAHDLLTSEATVLAFSDGPSLPRLTPPAAATSNGDDCRLRIISEAAIRTATLAAIDGTNAGDRIDLVMFYLSHRRIIRALRAAHQRGVTIRLLLDPNKDAFGRTKQGLPNRQVGHELHRKGIPIRWAATHGEQCHAKMLLVAKQDGERRLLLGSANFTRRNLDDLNLETDVEVRGQEELPVFAAAARFFDTMWHNLDGRSSTVDYAAFADPSPMRYHLYRLLESTGICTF